MQVLQGVPVTSSLLPVYSIDSGIGKGIPFQAGKLLLIYPFLILGGDDVLIGPTLELEFKLLK